jgi:hypothetical protein
LLFCFYLSNLTSFPIIAWFFVLFWTAVINYKNDFQRFKTYFDGIHGNFLARLKKNYPALTQNELRHCAFIKLKLSTKDIAILTNVQDTSVQRSRVRLKKKLRLTMKQDLYSFLECF